MSLLAIDIGNTNIACGLFKGKRIIKRWFMSKELCRSASVLSWELKRNIGARHIKEIDGVCICSVVPRLDDMFRNACQAALGIRPLFASAENAGMPIKDYDKKQLGADRIVAALAAYDKYKKALIVVDAGSAITIDLVTASGEFAGGVIVPGLDTSARTLHKISTKLPYVKPTVVKRTTGRNTKEAISAGLFHGYAGLVDHLVQKISKEAKARPLVIATGGESALLKRSCTTIDHVHNNLIFEGLRLVWKRR